MPAITKGERFAITARMPTFAEQHLRQRAKDLDVPLGDFLGYSVLLAEGFDIPPESLRATPQLVRLYPSDQWREVTARQPADVAARIRRELTEVFPPEEEQLPLTG
ncbi:hypothetical protein [Actinomadura sp. 3N407]|uniref:hypothetical protein n=1 Tax=Actinomadura sp. 3N407 TaxID=3457423 RepID=UPI003FCD8E33